MKALEGLRILDLTTVVSGPYAGSLLADMGAEVIKIEPPTGDSARSFEGTEPLYTMDGLSPHILTLQRNKRSVVINLRSQEGNQVFLDLVRVSDVVLENYRPGVSERLGISYPSLKAINERIIVCSITGYGLTGPARGRAALDACIQAYSGVMGITGEPEGAPLRAAPLYGDLCSGMAGALGVLAAVTARQRDGTGQHIDISMFDVQLSMMNYTATMQMMSGLPSPRVGNQHALHVPYNSYKVADGWLFVAIVLNAHWPAFLKVLGTQSSSMSHSTYLEFLNQPKFTDRIARLQERDAINSSIAPLLVNNTRGHWLDVFSEAGIPVAPVNSVEEALNDPQAAARNMIAEIRHPNGESYRAPGNPIRLSEAGPDVFQPPPLMGEHTASVLRDVLGYDATRITKLIESEAVAEHNAVEPNDAVLL